jgi:hypothetical protein
LEKALWKRASWGWVGIMGAGVSRWDREVQRVDERLARPFTIGSGDSSW